MVTTELTASSRARARATLAATAALCATTAGGALAGALAPGLVSPVAPHPTLTPTLGAWAAILLDNSRVLALPILLTAFGFHRGRYSARAGDIAVIGVLGANAILVGLELGPLAETSCSRTCHSCPSSGWPPVPPPASGHTPAQPPDDPTAVLWPFMPQSSSGC